MADDATDLVGEGDLVMLFDGREGRHFFRAETGMLKVGALGVVDGDRLLATRYGDPFEVGRFKGHVLRPTPWDLAANLKGKAQTVLPKDSGLIVMYCGVRPGSRVLEVGAGSGALSVALCEAVGPGGRVVSYEVRGDHAAVARNNLRRCGLGDRWELVEADAAEGIGGGPYDCAVVDVGSPWDVVAPVNAALKGGAVLCLYVPTTNQLERGVAAMAGEGMVAQESFEVLVRNMRVAEGAVRPSHQMLSHTAYLAFARKVRV